MQPSTELPTEAFKINKSTFVSNTFKSVSAITATAILGNVLFFHFLPLQDLKRSFGDLIVMPVLQVELIFFALLMASLGGEYERQEKEYLTNRGSEQPAAR